MEFLSGKMLAFIFIVYGLLGISQAFFFSGPHVCVSDNDALNCSCKNRENISITASMNFDIKWILISGCGVVTVPLGGIPHLQLEKIIFSDIYQLDIRPFALVGAQTLHTLKIEDISIFNVMTHGFVGLLNVTEVIIRNVTSMSLNEGSFGGVSTIENFLIDSSYFGEIKDNAFILTNITTFSVIDTRIDSLNSYSFLIHNAKEVLFRNCSIQDTRNNSFSMSYVDSLTFSNCNFGILATDSIYLKSSGSFNFEACTVSELSTYAFVLMISTNKITFTHNIIQFAYDYFLFLSNENSTSEDSSIYTCCNSFLCNCNIYWMWKTEKEPFYDSLLGTSSCIEIGTNFSSMKPIFDSHGNCKTLESNKNRKVTDSFTKSTDGFTKVTMSSTQISSAGKLFDISLVYLVILWRLIVFTYKG